MSSIGDTVVSQSIETTAEIHANKLIMSRYALSNEDAENKDDNREGQLFFNLVTAATPDNAIAGFYLSDGFVEFYHLNQAPPQSGGAV